ncbi:ATP-binding protein [Streptomyces litchfieldiae]|uniref:ATP-binding protein n=1 Tax=Streptomyces litchfieldiae TaxID=3075543 RepID=A0ABU2N061_9ACTN|nr:ATP-binding protein [Streptomyces sp. DSM 44938]MDT0347286.1 ATP-binding protein [Streptomyces sp. DSM 44938]
MFVIRRAFRYWSSDDSPGRARKAVRNAVLAWECGQQIAEVAELLTSELATNAVVHAPESSAYLVEVDVSGRLLTVSVIDYGPGRPRVVDAGAEEEGGRGLDMVKELAAAWGVEPAPAGGKRVFFSLDIPELPTRVYEREIHGQGGNVEQRTRRHPGIAHSCGTDWFCLRPRLRCAW